MTGAAFEVATLRQDTNANIIIAIIVRSFSIVWLTRETGSQLYGQVSCLSTLDVEIQATAEGSK